MNVDEIDSVTPDMDLTAGYVFRAPTEIVLDANFLRNGWRRAGFDLARDAWVVVDRGGTVVGYGHAMRGAGPHRRSSRPLLAQHAAGGADRVLRVSDPRRAQD